MLEALKLLVRAQIRVLVVQPHHQADVHEIRSHVVDEAPAIVLAHDPRHRPPHAVHHGAGFVVGGIDLPHLLDSKSVGLGRHAFTQIVLLHDSFAQGPPAALRQHDLLPKQLHSGLISVLLLAIHPNADVGSLNTHNRSVLSKHWLIRSEARIDFHPQLFRLVGQPSTQYPQAQDVVPLIVHFRWQQEVRNFDRPLFVGQPIEVVIGDLGVENFIRPILCQEPGEQFPQRSGLEDISG
mmetsp:Transcript_22903/g.55416  ORF Transcript_22903/g.55416 Transcript_22903/m.55416 type:complete len:238 (-) Transcript_22903:253-966(-)